MVPFAPWLHKEHGLSLNMTRELLKCICLNISDVNKLDTKYRMKVQAEAHAKIKRKREQLDTKYRMKVQAEAHAKIKRKKEQKLRTHH
jgi:hypothetical protein